MNKSIKSSIGIGIFLVCLSIFLPSFAMVKAPEVPLTKAPETSRAMEQAPLTKAPEVAMTLEQALQRIKRHENKAHQLLSCYNNLIPLIQSDDLDKLMYLLEDDLLCGINGNCSNRHVLFIKYMIEALSSHNEKYAEPLLVARARYFFDGLAGKNAALQQNVVKRARMDGFLQDIGRIDDMGAFGKFYGDFLLFTLSCLRSKRVVLPELKNYKKLNREEAPLYLLAQKVLFISKECRVALAECIETLYKSYNPQLSQATLEDKVRRADVSANQLIDKIIAMQRDVRDNKEFEHHNAVEFNFSSILDTVPAECLKKMLFFLAAPFLNPVLSQGIAIKLMTIMPNSAIAVEADNFEGDRRALKSMLMHLITQEKPGKVTNNYRSNLHLFLSTLETLWKGTPIAEWPYTWSAKSMLPILKLRKKSMQSYLDALREQLNDLPMLSRQSQASFKNPVLGQMASGDGVSPAGKRPRPFMSEGASAAVEIPAAFQIPQALQAPKVPQVTQAAQSPPSPSRTLVPVLRTSEGPADGLGEEPGESPSKSRRCSDPNLSSSLPLVESPKSFVTPSPGMQLAKKLTATDPRNMQMSQLKFSQSTSDLRSAELNSSEPKFHASMPDLSSKRKGILVPSRLVPEEDPARMKAKIDYDLKKGILVTPRVYQELVFRLIKKISTEKAELSGLEAQIKVREQGLSADQAGVDLLAKLEKMNKEKEELTQKLAAKTEELSNVFLSFKNLKNELLQSQTRLAELVSENESLKRKLDELEDPTLG